MCLILSMFETGNLRGRGNRTDNSSTRNTTTTTYASSSLTRRTIALSGDFDIYIIMNKKRATITYVINNSKRTVTTSIPATAPKSSGENNSQLGAWSGQATTGARAH